MRLFERRLPRFPSLAQLSFYISNSNLTYRDLASSPINTTSQKPHYINMSRRFATYGGLAAVGGVTYYLYSAGGDPKLAERKAERTSWRYSTFKVS